MSRSSGPIAHLAVEAGLSSLWFLGLVFALAGIGLVALWLWGRRSRPADDDTLEFARGLQALAPRSAPPRSRELVSHGRGPVKRQR